MVRNHSGKLLDQLTKDNGSSHAAIINDNLPDKLLIKAKSHCHVDGGQEG
ncbi:MAG TPA: hypothetical protein VGK47_07280 [Nitrososphaeraceae archaeon]